MPMRPGRCYSHVTSQPYTRREYIHGAPQPKISKFTAGTPSLMDSYEVKVSLVVSSIVLFVIVSVVLVPLCIARWYVKVFGDM